jgi:hypothetical protein
MRSKRHVEHLTAFTIEKYAMLRVGVRVTIFIVKSHSQTINVDDTTYKYIYTYPQPNPYPTCNVHDLRKPPVPTIRLDLLFRRPASPIRYAFNQRPRLLYLLCGRTSFKHPQQGRLVARFLADRATPGASLTTQGIFVHRSFPQSKVIGLRRLRPATLEEHPRGDDSASRNVRAVAGAGSSFGEFFLILDHPLQRLEDTVVRAAPAEGANVSVQDRGRRYRE